jgi:hypothetical protein
MARIFISHSSKDNFEAIAFRDWLVSEGWARDDIFLDLHGIGAGERWKEALKKANERCKAVVLLASPASLSSTECRLEIRMAEDYGKEIVVAILYLLDVESDELAEYRERQIVDLSAEPREASFTVEHDGQQKTIHFNRETLRRIKARLDQLGISPTSFPWRPGDLAKASPYPGLRGFEPEDAALFFGRAGDLARGLGELRKLRRGASGQVLVIQAASGAGKSSYLKAGLWPRLERDPDFLPLAILRPATGILTGDNGLGRQLAAFFAARHRPVTAAQIHQALANPHNEAATELVRLINDAVQIGHEAREIADPNATPPTPLIAVDQAEELFGTDDRQESQRFLRLIARLLDPDGDTPALLAPPLFTWTIRADSMDALLHATGEAGLAPPELFPLPPIKRDAYREIIEAPLTVANQAGMRVSIDPLLVDELVAQSDGADALPLLAFTLRQLFEDSRVGSKAELTLTEYQAAGGIGGILTRRLSAARQQTGALEDDLCQLLLPRLVTWDPQANPPGAKRLVAPEAELFADERARLKPLADALVEERLLTRGGDAAGETTLEVAHEALLRQPPISSWLEDDHQFLIWRDELGRARRAFERDERSLLMGRELEIARSWLETRRADLSEADAAFIDDSMAADDQRRADEERREGERQEAELAAARAQEQAAQRVARRTTAGLVVAIALALVAGAAGVYAYFQQQEAVQQADLAQQEAKRADESAAIAERERQRALGRLQQAQRTESRFLAQQSRRFAEQRRYVPAALLAMGGLPDRARGRDGKVLSDRPYVPEAEAALHDAGLKNKQRVWIVGHTGAVNSAAFSPDGARIVTGSDDNTARIWDAETGAELVRLESHAGGVFSAAFSPDRAHRHRLR